MSPLVSFPKVIPLGVVPQDLQSHSAEKARSQMAMLVTEHWKVISWLRVELPALSHRDHTVP